MFVAGNGQKKKKGEKKNFRNPRKLPLFCSIGHCCSSNAVNEHRLREWRRCSRFRVGRGDQTKQMPSTIVDLLVTNSGRTWMTGIVSSLVNYNHHRVPFRKLAGEVIGTLSLAGDSTMTLAKERGAVHEVGPPFNVCSIKLLGCISPATRLSRVFCKVCFLQC